MYKMMYCYDKYSNLLCIVENKAITRITLHTDGFYIYVERNTGYDVILETEYCIKCCWTKTYNMSVSMIKKVSLDTLIIFNEDTVRTSEVSQTLINF